MTRRSNHAHAEQFQRPRDIGVAGLEMFAPLVPIEPARAPQQPIVSIESARRTDDRRKAKLIKDARYRRWIEAGKPVVLAVLKRDGKVTSATFRLEAEALGDVLPPNYGDQRALAYIPQMFAEMEEAGHLQTARHANGDAIQIFDKKSRNGQNVYLPTGLT